MAKQAEATEEVKITGILAEKLFPIDEIESSTRTYNCLRNIDIQYVQELLYLTGNDLLTVKNMGARSTQEVEDIVSKLGGSLGAYAGKIKKRDARLSSEVRIKAMHKDFNFEAPASAAVKKTPPKIEIPEYFKGNVHATLSPYHRLSVGTAQTLEREGIKSLGALALMTRKELAKIFECSLRHPTITQIEDRLQTYRLRLATTETDWAGLRGEDGKISEQTIIDLYELNTFVPSRYTGLGNSLTDQFKHNEAVLLPIADIEWPAEHAEAIKKATAGKHFLGELLFIEDNYFGYSHDGWGRNPKYKRAAREVLRPYGLDIEIIPTNGMTPAFLQQEDRRTMLANVFGVDPTAKPVVKTKTTQPLLIKTEHPPRHSYWADIRLPGHLRGVFAESTLKEFANTDQIWDAHDQLTTALVTTLTQDLISGQDQAIVDDQKPDWLTGKWLFQHLPRAMRSALTDEYLERAARKPKVIELVEKFNDATQSALLASAHEILKNFTAGAVPAATPSGS